MRQVGSLSSQKPTVFIVHNNEDVNTLLAGTFWLKGFQSAKFTDGKECLKRVREIDGNVDALVINLETALDNNDLMLIVNMKRINPNAKILVLVGEELDETKMYEYGADEIFLTPLSPIDIIDKLILLISKSKGLERQNDLV
jgi:DNA-binding response OmpR family regulator